MSELNRHIKKLLSENDIAIIPHFGGFLAHYIPAVRDSKNNLFIPPKRTIGFNQQLKLNDGLLIQSYMNELNISFQEANNLMKADINTLKKQLDENGSILIDGIGTIFCNTNEKYSFKELEDTFDCPLFFGMSSFQMLEVEELINNQSQPQQIPSRVDQVSRGHRINDFLGGVAVLCVIIASFFLFSPSVESTTKVTEENLAKVLPLKVWTLSVAPNTEVDNKVKITPTENIDITSNLDETIIDDSAIVTTTKSEITNAVEEDAIKVAPIESLDFHIIVASLIPLKKAELLIGELKELGFESAQILNKKGKRRVSLGSYGTRADAQKILNTPSVQTHYPSAWILNNK